MYRVNPSHVHPRSLRNGSAGNSPARRDPFVQANWQAILNRRVGSASNFFGETEALEIDPPDVSSNQRIKGFNPFADLRSTLLGSSLWEEGSQASSDAL